MYFALVNDTLLIIFSFIGILTAFIYISIVFCTHDQKRQKNRSLADLLAANSSIAGFLLNILNFIDAIIMWYADTNMIENNQRQPDAFCVLRGGFRTACLGAMYYSLCIQAFNRFCCIIYAKRLSLHSSSLYIYLIIIQWILSTISVIPVLLSNQIIYNSNGHFCQVSLQNPYAFPYLFFICYFLPLIFIIYMYIKIILHLYHQSITERFRRQQPIRMLRHIIYMLIILSSTGIPTGFLFIQTQINHKLVPNNGQKLSMILVTFSHASVMIYTLILTANVRRSFIRSLIVPYQMETQIEHISPIKMNLTKLPVQN